MGVAGADAKPIQPTGFQSADHALEFETVMYRAPLGVGFVIAAGFHLEQATAHGAFPAERDVGGMRGRNGAHVGDFGRLTHGMAFRDGEFHAGGLPLVGAMVQVVELPKLGACDSVPG